MEKRDVIIVGAGPAGLSCAKVLAEAGRDVLVLEKNKVIGDKLCGGALTIKDLEVIPKKLVERSFNSFVIRTPKSKKWISTNSPRLFMINRRTLGKWQFQEAKKTGAEIRLSSCVNNISKTYVSSNNKKIRFNYLVGADGSNSIVRKSLGIETDKKKIGVCLEFKTKKIYPKVEFFLESKLFGAGCAWIFPKRKYTLIGCGSYPKDNLKESFYKFLKDKKIKAGKIHGSIINTDYRGYYFKNKFLIGDAAGLVIRFSGEGIYSAIISGQEVAKMIIENKTKSKVMNELIKSKLKRDLIGDFINNLGLVRSSFYDLGVKLLKNRFFQEEFIEILETPSP